MLKWEALKKAAKMCNVSLRELSRTMGRTDNFISAYISRGGDVGVDNYNEMLNACDYVLCAIPKDAIPKDAIPITNE